jgi:ABC-type Fe3+-hydroxamate transport system substrate-binding protein
MAYRVRDDMGRDLTFARPPVRIVSLVPSDTFTVVALGAGERLVGRTRYCVEPAAEVHAIPSVGGTKDADVDAIAALEPDVVLANQEENARPILEGLATRGVPVFVSFPRRVADGLALIARLARLLGIEELLRARALVAEAYAVAATLATTPPPVASAFVPVWDDPLMTFADHTYAADLLAHAGLTNAFGDRERRYPLAADLGRRSPISADRLGDRDTRYPRVTLDEVIARAPDVVLLPDEPHAFGPADVDRFAALAIPAAVRRAIHLTSGKDLFWSGAWSIQALPRLRARVASLPVP